MKRLPLAPLFALALPQIGLAAAVDSDLWSADTTTGEVVRITKATDTAGTPLATGTGSYQLAVDDTSVWVIDYESDDLHRIDKVTGLITATIDVTTSMFGIGVDE
ncbi:MAG: hypothetical protein JRI25_23980, partial [Deltaproteobacteria bacterium]|nr:hypothetical protein [Deltaproteobacteria bacterium]